MGVRFRRIEDRKQSVMQMRRRTAEGQQRRRVLPKVVIFIVLLLVAGGLYLYFAPPRIVAPFVVTVEPMRVLAPVSGTVTWTLDKGETTVSSGEVIARIAPGAQSGGSPGARREDLRVRAAAAQAALESEQAAVRVTEAELAEKESDLRAAQERLPEALERARADLQQATDRLASLEADRESAQRLHRLGAITGADLARAERDCDEARAAREKAESDLRALQDRKAAGDVALEKFQATRVSSLGAARTRVEGARAGYEAVQKALKASETPAPDQQGDFVLAAPTDARVLALHAAAGGQVRQDDLVATLYRPETRAVAVYVPARCQGLLHVGSTANLYPRGGKGPVSGRIERIDGRVVALPSELAANLPYEQTYCIVAEVKLPAAADGALPPGMVGKAVLEKR